MTDIQKLCGIEGGDDESLSVGRFNKWFHLYVKLHVAPTHEKMSSIHAAQVTSHSQLREYMLHDTQAHARIDGGLRVLKWMIPVVSFFISVIIGLGLYAYHSELKVVSTNIAEIKEQVKVGVLPVAKERIDRNQDRIERLERK